MPSIAQIADAMTGSLLLARRDTGGYRYFEVSVNGFWQSFLAVILILPFYLSITAAEQNLAIELGDQTTPDGDNIGFIRLLVLAIGWVTFPLAMVWVCKALGLRNRYVIFIIVYNWTSVLAIAMLTPPFVLYQIGLIGAANTALLYIILTACVVYYRWFIAQTALMTTAVNAAGIVVFDIALSFTIWKLLTRLLG